MRRGGSTSHIDIRFFLDLYHSLIGLSKSSQKDTGIDNKYIVQLQEEVQAEVKAGAREGSGGKCSLMMMMIRMMIRMMMMERRSGRQRRRQGEQQQQQQEVVVEEEEDTFCLVGLAGGLESALLPSTFTSSGSASCRLLLTPSDASSTFHHLLPLEQAIHSLSRVVLPIVEQEALQLFLPPTNSFSSSSSDSSLSCFTSSSSTSSSAEMSIYS
eukprot:759928-Hanusia_phi.AAC.2